MGFITTKLKRFPKSEKHLVLKMKCEKIVLGMVMQAIPQLIRFQKKGEFDLILVTNSVLIIIELKDWNGKSIKSTNGNWYMDERDMGVSPVSLTRQKQFILVSKLKGLKDKFKGNPGFVQGYISLL